MQDLHFDALMDKCGDSKTGIILTRRQRAWLILGLWCIAVDRWHVDRWHCIITQERKRERERALSSSLHVVFCWKLSLYLCVRQNQLSADNWSGSGSKCDFDFPQKRGWRTAFKVEHEPLNRSKVEKLRERKDDRYTRFYINAVLVSFLFFFVRLESHRDVK